jgi:putative ABC transport system substrate-binding protein
MQFGQLKRREFITLLGGAAATWPLAVHGQTPEVPRIGFVYPGPKAAAAIRVEAVLSGLRVSGYAAPAQVEIVVRTADGDPAQIVPLVAEVTAKNVNAIIANGPAVLHAARSATRTIPIVAIDLESDPVTSGVAASLAHPEALCLHYIQKQTYLLSRRVPKAAVSRCSKRPLIR